MKHAAPLKNQDTHSFSGQGILENPNYEGDPA